MTSSPDQPFVRLQGVSKSYGAGRNQVHVLDGVDLELRSGETTSLIGRSGSGKSTLIALIAGLMHPDVGHIRIGGLRTDTLNEAERADLRAERIGVVTHHLFSGKHRGVFLRLDTIDEKALAKGYRELKKQAPQEEVEGEGVMKELQAL